jgi:hypothetical protein
MPRRIHWWGACALLFALIVACGGDDGDETPATADTSPTDTGPTDTTPGDTAIDGTTTSPGGDTAGTFSLLTYNVAGLPQEISDENPEVNIPLISPLLEDYDVVVTQEDFDWWSDDIAELDFVNYHDRLRADVTHPHRTEAHAGPEAVGIDGSNPERPVPMAGDGLGVLSRFPFRDLERVPWTRCFGGADTSDGGAGDCLAMKGFLVVTVELAPGVEFDLYTLHAEAGSTDADVEMRAENYLDLADHIAQRSEGRAVIVAGDMNLHLEPDHRRVDTDTPVWEQFLADTGLADVCDEIECEVPGSIDKVAWRDGGGVAFEPLERRWETDRFADDAGEDLSDHPPVAVDWFWSATN